MSDADRAANVLGALALVITDQTSAAIESASGQALSTSAALSALAEFLDRPSIDDLRKVLGLTHSAAVRLVDRLESAGLVSRRTGADARSRTLVLTARGRRAAGRVAAARAQVLAGVLDGMSGKQLEQLNSLLAVAMTNLVQAKEGGAWTCRLCDLQACERAAGHCPAANAAMQKYGLPALPS